jgi:hypothetical protein
MQVLLGVDVHSPERAAGKSCALFQVPQGMCQHCQNWRRRVAYDSDSAANQACSELRVYALSVSFLGAWNIYTGFSTARRAGHALIFI